ncbi:hypothetical protein [Vibrio mimicus]|uniref:hypothetical protein n=1 Tax=Vibrio mimicus TaxID=674 RepID=UPI000592C60A|nr:hypothetical protein [Vibrio mimicus]
MCKKYLLIAMLLVGSASHSLRVSANPVMKFEGTIDSICSGNVIASGAKEVFFGSGSASSEHIHTLRLTSNERTKVGLGVAPTTQLVRFGANGAPANILLKSKTSKDVAYEIKDEFNNLDPNKEISIYLDASGMNKNEFAKGTYSYVVTATISCN